MKEISIYMAMSSKSPRAADRTVGFVMAYNTAKGAATLTKITKLENVTRNQAELELFVMSLKRVHQCDVAFSIYADFSYVRSAFLRGLTDKWAANDYKKANGEPISNEDKWRETLILLNGREISFHEEIGEYSRWLQDEVDKGDKHNV